MFGKLSNMSFSRQPNEIIEWHRCANDKHIPKLYSSGNNMNPGIVPPQLQVALMNYYCFIFVPDVLSLLLLLLLLLFLFLMFITSKGNQAWGHYILNVIYYYYYYC